MRLALCRVDVVTHSMGGLVMKSLLALHATEFERLVRKWIAVAVPFGGAPGGQCMVASGNPLPVSKLSGRG